MKNVIFILADSIFSECMGCGRTEISTTPFIDKLAEKGFYASSVYSYGPYTDAATIGLYCANPTLENYGYYFGINTANYNHFKLFKDAGYETFGFFYPYYLISSNTRKDIDWPIYTGGFKYESIWGGKLQYYKERKDKGGLTDLEYRFIEKCMDMVFDCWLGFYDDIMKKGNAAIVSTLKDETIGGTGIEGLKRQYRLYKEAKREYINSLLDLGMDHPLAKVNEFDYGKIVDKKFLTEIYRRHKKEMSKISQINIKYALKNSPFKWKKALSHMRTFAKTHRSEDVRYIANYGMLLSANKMMKERSLKQRNWQEVASLNKQIDTLIDMLQRRERSDKPFYASIHALEPHHNISYFSFDSFDQETVDKEFEYIMPLLSGLGHNFCGNVIYQLSLRYVDLCIKRLYDKLGSLGLLDNTVIALVADHGSSYTFNPLRNTVVNTFHKENYNIPVMIWSRDLNQIKRIDGFYMSDDILPTVMSIAGLDHSFLCGRDMSKNGQAREFIITEYMGPGVPDMISREVWISGRNKHYVIAYKAPIDKEIDIESPDMFYDLDDDPNELHPISVLKDTSEVRIMVNAIKERFEEIQKRTDVFIEKLDRLKFP